MLTLRNKRKGFTIIEVMCSIGVFSILFLSAMSIYLSTIKMRVYNDEMAKNTAYLENVKNEIISNISCDEIKDLSEAGKVFLNSENFNQNVLSNSNISELFSNENKLEMPYIQISAEDGELQYIKIKMYTKILDKVRILNCEFYKGRN